MSTQTHEVAVQAWARLLHAHAAATRELSGELQAEHELTINDYEALLLLSRAKDGALRRVDLAGGLLLTPSGVTRLLDGLERSGLVTKATCDHDARVTYAVLTDAGRERLDAAARSHVAGVEALFASRFSPEELASLAELLGRLSGPVDAACTPE